jgi:hypothetical protein
MTMWLEIIFGKVTCADVFTERIERNTEIKKTRTEASHLGRLTETGNSTRDHFSERERYQSRRSLTIPGNLQGQHTCERNVLSDCGLMPEKAIDLVFKSALKYT